MPYLCRIFITNALTWVEISHNKIRALNLLFHLVLTSSSAGGSTKFFFASRLPVSLSRFSTFRSRWADGLLLATSALATSAVG